ncbi:MAG: cell envelope integrity EipB family protein [Alphaproteobacteria bacterium]|nr:cell envelope integrity EipB family protein [Alphaproteobacteria bacterium]
MHSFAPGRGLFCLGFVAISAAGLVPGVAQAQGPAGSVKFAPHVAIYDLKLTSSRGKRLLESARGRIVYDFSGSSCEGYSLQFRQVTELDSGEGKASLSDLRTSTWEEGDGKSFRFQSQNYMDDKRISEVDGQADRAKEKVAVKLTKPGGKKFDAGKVVFPTEHMRLLIEAARAGKTLLEVNVYDGSESGEKIYQSLSVIGKKIEPDKKLDDAAAGKDVLAGLARWPVTISYFDKTAKKAEDDLGEQTPVYAISFELYENGISRELKLDYGDFVIDGKMSSLEIKPVKACK